MPVAASTLDRQSAVEAIQRPVLVVDDNALVRRLIADFVAEMGFEPIEAANAEEALTLARQERPSLILMDIVMPGANGLEAMQRIRAMPDIAATPIIAVTTLAGGPGEAEFLAAGFDAYLPKPLDLERFASVLRQHLG